MNSNNHILSPLRYPGSKRRLSSYVSKALELNNLNPKLYIEPFVGGASIALQLIFDDAIEQVILIDRDPLIAHFWEAVFFDTNWLVEQIETIEITLEKWHEYKSFKPRNKRDYALTCLFLNRTSFSGIMRGEVGPLGGRDQKSEYKIDCRFPRDTLVRRVKRIAEFKHKVKGIWACKWSEGIHHIREMQLSEDLPNEDVFFYFDPPFFNKAEGLYRYYFDTDDHVELRDFLLILEDHWILSYDNAEEVGRLYGQAIENETNGTKKHDVELIYSTGIMTGLKPTKEVIISNLKELPAETRFWKTASGH
ncbi:MAG: DNA adenine methylase [Anaerolineales bacterium]|jgi:DNA adenine methylase